MLTTQTPVDYTHKGPGKRGQGKKATTILADQGDYVTVISDVPYTVRSKHTPATSYKGARPMHRTTLTIPTQAYTDYNTSNNVVSTLQLAIIKIILPNLLTMKLKCFDQYL